MTVIHKPRDFLTLLSTLQSSSELTAKVSDWLQAFVRGRS